MSHTSSPSAPILLNSKPRFEILDGLRGVAAIIVVIYHLFETYSTHPCNQIVNHGYLAVDFFYILSGFVIGYAYDDRWDRMTTWDFFKRRLIRLQPMVIMGSIIGAFWFYFSDAPMFSLVMETPWWKMLIFCVLGCLMIPTPPSADIRGWQEINSLNGAQWSLLWEYVANIIYALFIRRLSKVMLLIFVVCSAFLTLDVCLNLDAFGMLASRDAASAYSVIGGYSLTPQEIYIALARLLFPFFGGLLLYRVHKMVSIPRSGFLICSLIVAATLAWPHIGGSTPNILNGVYCFVAILLRHKYDANDNQYLDTLGYDYDFSTLDARADKDVDPDAPICIGMDYNANINWIVAGQPRDRRLNVIKSFYVKFKRKIPALVQDFCRYYAEHRNKTVVYYFDATALGSNYAVNEQDFRWVVVHEFERQGWRVEAVYLGNPMRHDEKYLLINQGFAGKQRLMPFFNRSNNEDLILAIQSAGVSRGRNGFRKDKSGEKLAESEEDLLEHRTDGTDAFDTLYIGAEKFPFHDSFSLSMSGVL